MFICPTSTRLSLYQSVSCLHPVALVLYDMAVCMCVYNVQVGSGCATIWRDLFLAVVCAPFGRQAPVRQVHLLPCILHGSLNTDDGEKSPP